ncbi:MAG: hypothetical protein JWN03_8541 [Nocardia sp.]|nr:hypothetical protein [Nocardia sp.]
MGRGTAARRADRDRAADSVPSERNSGRAADSGLKPVNLEWAVDCGPRPVDSAGPSDAVPRERDSPAVVNSGLLEEDSVPLTSDSGRAVVRAGFLRAGAAAGQPFPSAGRTVVAGWAAPAGAVRGRRGERRTPAAVATDAADATPRANRGVGCPPTSLLRGHGVPDLRPGRRNHRSSSDPLSDEWCGRPYIGRILARIFFAKVASTELATPVSAAMVKTNAPSLPPGKANV